MNEVSVQKFASPASSASPTKRVKALVDRKESSRSEWIEDKTNRYSSNVKVNNWYEERADVSYIRSWRPLISEYGHNFASIYTTSFLHPIAYIKPELMKFPAPILPSEAHIFPCHQPELDLPALKAKYKSYETTFRVAYIDPKLQWRPIKTISAASEPNQWVE